MKLKTLTMMLAAGAMALSASIYSGESNAADKKITVVTWNIPYF